MTTRNSSDGRERLLDADCMPRLTGLRERMMTPEMAAEAMRAYTQETNRLNRERRNTADATRRELAETAKAIAEIVRVIE